MKRKCWPTRLYGSAVWLPLCLLSMTFGCSSAGGGEKSFHGVVEDAAGNPVKGIFVQARNLKSGITTSVLSDRQGSYWFDSLPPGEYDLGTQSVGFTTDGRKDLGLEADQSVAVDFTVEERPITWTELSFTDYLTLLPEHPTKGKAIHQCHGCHGVRWHSIHPKDLSGWRETVNWMRTEWSYYFGDDLKDEDVEGIASYFASLFGPASELPEYPDIERREYSDEAMKIVYVDYELPTRRAFPWSGVPDGKGNVWIPEYNSNQIGKLNPKTGVIKEYKVPFPERAAIHSSVPAPDGTVWLTEASTAYRIAKFDPETETFTEYPDPREEGIPTKHTNVVDVKGRIWTSGGDVITSFDPKTETFSYYGDKPLDWKTYGVATDKEGNVWFTRLGNHSFGKIDASTGEVTEWDRPKGAPRRIHVDSKGNVWFGEFFASKAVKFDPKTETFKEYPLPGPDARPYGVGIDANDDFWYYAWGRSEIGWVNASTGQITQYPVPYIDPTMRDFFRDSEGHMWYGAPNANKVGYFYLRNGE